MKLLRKLYYLFLLIADISASKNGRNATKVNNKNMVIVKTDAIGDYFLFRNFLPVLRKYYAGYHITLIGNQIWKPLCDEYDAEYIDSALFLNIKKFQYDLGYRKKQISILQSITAAILINPIHSRNIIVDDAISHAINADVKLASKGDNYNQIPFLLPFTYALYTDLFQCSPEIQFEFYRNLTFFKWLTSDDNLTTEISLRHLENRERIILIAIGASQKKRKWGVDLLSQLIIEINQLYPEFRIVLIGDQTDIENAIQIQNLCNIPIENKVGKTNLGEVVSLICKADVLVCYDSMFQHTAAAAKTPCIVISNGKHFGRFTPYPKEIAPHHLTVFPFSDNTVQRYTLDPKVLLEFSNGREGNILDIEPQIVLQAINQLIGTKDFDSLQK